LKRIKVGVVVKVEEVAHRDRNGAGVFRLSYHWQGGCSNGQGKEGRVISNTVRIWRIAKQALENVQLSSEG
jgi:hypothetical protein